MPIVDRYTCLYNASFSIKNRVLIFFRIPKIVRFLLLTFSNIVLPILLKRDIERYSSTEKNTGDFVVSFTSFPQRISRLHLVVYTLLLQTLKPKKIVLYLSNEQFTSIDQLPKRLLALQSAGLTIQLMPGDLRSYKKYYYQLSAHPTENFVIVDDDIFYPSKLFENLYTAHLNNPRKVCANRCARIDPQKPYRNWKLLTGTHPLTAVDLIPTGCGGVFYPAGSLSNEAINLELFTRICPDADDIWLNVCAYLNKTEFLYTGKFIYYLPVLRRQNATLHSKNVTDNGNDKKFLSVREHFLIQKDVDVLNRANKS